MLEKQSGSTERDGGGGRGSKLSHSSSHAVSRLHNTVPTVQVCPATHSRNAREVFRDAIGVSSRVADAVFGCELDQLLERNPMIHLRGYETKLSISSSPADDNVLR